MSRLNKLLQKFDRGSSRALQVEDGQTVEVRLLPPYGKDDIARAKALGGDLDPASGILVYTVHPWLPMIGENNRDEQGNLRRTTYRCKKDFKKPCGFCEFFDNLDKEDRDLMYRHGRQGLGMCDVYVRETGETKRWFLRKKLMERMEEIMELYPELNDQKRGISLFISRKGSGLQTRWSVKPGSKRWPLKVNLDDLPDILEEMKNTKRLKDSAIQKVLDLAWKTKGESND